MNGIGNFKLIALDSNAFIYYFEDNQEFVPFVKQIFEQMSLNKLKAVTSIISVIETLSYPSPDTVISEIKETFLAIPNLTILNLNYSIALKAAQIRRDHKLRLPDAVQLATAIEMKAQVFITNDQRLQQFKKLKVLLLNQL